MDSNVLSFELSVTWQCYILSIVFDSYKIISWKIFFNELVRLSVFQPLIALANKTSHRACKKLHSQSDRPSCVTKQAKLMRKTAFYAFVFEGFNAVHCRNWTAFLSDLFSEQFLGILLYSRDCMLWSAVDLPRIQSSSFS